MKELETGGQEPQVSCLVHPPGCLTSYGLVPLAVLELLDNSVSCRQLRAMPEMQISFVWWNVTACCPVTEDQLGHLFVSSFQYSRLTLCVFFEFSFELVVT